MPPTNDSTDGQAVDETGDPIAKDDDDPRNEPTGVRSGPDGREVVVPLRLYKTVMVFSTLAAVVTFFVGFTLIDSATLQFSFVRTMLEFLLASVGLLPPSDVLTALLAIGGLLSILTGTAIYVLGTRFRAQGMGKPQEDSSED